ncbi:hypothetical protein QFC19_008973 [Naganishia cerealis]|uniref:Uncharacterized protein n=2 Tax=Naganishia cerealis TaxID=610337 RepID=A0ACC2UWA8_9TREE|nr:hypothetical protein QFC19_009219 [Naganishia cerealis]KAJ9091763.1 hypothetical protein QFC19_008973 [Naganishia cerealis]
MTNRLPLEEASSTPPGKKKSTRTAVACKSCHGLKVKCTPADERNPSGPCLRCFNAKRKCEVDYSHSRKKKKKNEASPVPDSALSYSDHIHLYDGASDAYSNGNANIIAKQEETIAKLTEQVRILKQQSSSSANRSPIEISPLISETDSLGFVLKSDLESELAILAQSNTNLNELAHKLKETADRRNSLLNEGFKRDLVSQGYLTIEEASRRIDLYNTRMFPQHPHVVIPPVTDVEVFRIEQPFLFNCVMSVTNSVHPGPIDQDLALTIENIATMGVSIEVMVTGTKSVELIKCLLLLSLWYNNPEMFRNRRYHILNVLSVTLLHDLGIVAKPNDYFMDSDKDLGSGGTSNTEYRRLVMTLYSITVSFCLILRRSIFVKWTPFVEKCCAELESSTDERWREFAVFLRLNHQLDRIHNIVHAPEVSERDYSPSVYVVHEMQNVLALIKAKLSKSNHAYRAYYYSVEAYLHEPILSQVLIYDSNSSSDVHLNEKAVKLIVNCTAACLNSIQEFNQLRIEELAAIPLCYASRIIYTAGMLLRLRYLILLLPSHIEKDLVPRRAIQVIQRLNDNFAEASVLHPFNHFLKKTRLVLQLFIQTYVSQVHDILQKSGGTPQNFKPVDPRAKEEMETLVTKPEGGGLITTASGAAYKSQVPIDYLLYAASYKENNPNATILEKRYAPESNTRENNSANGTPNKTASAGNVPPSNTNLTPQVGPEPQMPYFPKLTGTLPLSNNMTFLPRQMDRISGSFNYSQNQLETERLSDSFGALNDEFWGDLISNDSNRVNFTNSSANQLNDEVFFMN